MTVLDVINTTKESDPDIAGIKVSIEDKNNLTFLGNPTELFFGELADVPELMFTLEVLEISQICVSSDEKRNGAYVLLCE